MSLKLRAMTKADLEQITQVAQSAWINGIAPLLDDLKPQDLIAVENVFRGFFQSHLQGHSASKDKLVCADLGGQIVGFYNLDCEAAELTDLWITAQWQGQGIASALMRDAKDKARKMGANKLSLKVLAANERAIAFYEKFEFSETERAMSRDPVLRRAVDIARMDCCLQSE